MDVVDTRLLMRARGKMRTRGRGMRIKCGHRHLKSNDRLLFNKNRNSLNMKRNNESYDSMKLCYETTERRSRSCYDDQTKPSIKYITR